MDSGNFSSGGPYGRKPDFVVFSNKFAKHSKKITIILVIIIIAVLLLFNSLYTLESSEYAVITRFGQYIGQVTESGLQMKIPFVDDAHKVNMEAIYRLEFGFQSDAAGEISVPQEATMLTGDLNIVIADWVIMYKVKDAYNFLFKHAQPEETLKIVTESTYRRVVASHNLDSILTDQKDIIQNEIRADLQAICDKYQLGVQITNVNLQSAMPPAEVQSAFMDVASAKEEKESMINEASKYENEMLPVARGDAEKMINDAEGYKRRRINEALGDIARYQAIESEYLKNPSVTRTRLYMEMIRQVLPQVKDIYIMSDDGTYKVLPLGGNGILGGQ